MAPRSSQYTCSTATGPKLGERPSNPKPQCSRLRFRDTDPATPYRTPQRNNSRNRHITLKQTLTTKGLGIPREAISVSFLAILHRGMRGIGDLYIDT